MFLIPHDCVAGRLAIRRNGCKQSGYSSQHIINKSTRPQQKYTNTDNSQSEGCIQAILGELSYSLQLSINKSTLRVNGWIDWKDGSLRVDTEGGIQTIGGSWIFPHNTLETNQQMQSGSLKPVGPTFQNIYHVPWSTDAL